MMREKYPQLRLFFELQSLHLTSLLACLYAPKNLQGIVLRKWGIAQCSCLFECFHVLMNFDILLLPWVFTVVCKAIHCLSSFWLPNSCQSTLLFQPLPDYFLSSLHRCFLNVMLLQLSEYLVHSLYSVNIYWVKEWWMINILNESINKKCFLANHVKESTVLWRKYYFLLVENKILPISVLRKKL